MVDCLFLKKTKFLLRFHLKWLILKNQLHVEDL